MLRHIVPDVRSGDCRCDRGRRGGEARPEVGCAHVVGAGQVCPPVEPDGAVEDPVPVHHRVTQTSIGVAGVVNLRLPSHLADGVAEGALDKETVYKWTLITSDMFLTTTDLFVVDLDVVHGAVVDEVGHVAE